MLSYHAIEAVRDELRQQGIVVRDYRQEPPCPVFAHFHGKLVALEPRRDGRSVARIVAVADSVESLVDELTRRGLLTSVEC